MKIRWGRSGTGKTTDLIEIKMANNPDLEKALKQLKENQTKYTKTTRYYKGDHDLAFASAKFKNAFGSLFREFALNLCPGVCDAVRDKLRIENFNIEKGDKSLPEAAWEIWQRNRMGTRAGQVHKEAVKNGDAYAMVWVDPQKRVTIYPQGAANCTVFYDEETPGKILWAAKTWQTSEKKTRLNLYYADRIERYISTQKTTDELPDANGLIDFTGDGGDSLIINPYDVVPVFHFANNSDVGSFGESELVSAMPIQDALNKSVLDMLVAMEFAAYRQRWATGIEIEYDDEGKPIPPYTAGIERLWISESPEAKFGDFEAADLEKFLKVKAEFRIDLACATGTPMYYLMPTNGDMPSGESLKKSETRFINKVRDRQESFGQVWEDLMSFALLLEGKKDVRLFADWEDPSPLSEKEKLENIVIKKEIGIDDEQALIEAGYGESDIAAMLERKQAQSDAAVNRFNAGDEGDDLTEL